MRKQASSTGLRLPIELREKMDIFVLEGKCENLSQVVREALLEFFEKHPPPRHDLKPEILG